MGHFEFPLTVKAAGLTRDQALDLSMKLSSTIFKADLPDGVRIDSVGFGRIEETQGVTDMMCPQCGREFTCDVPSHADHGKGPHICRGCHDLNIRTEVEEGRKNLLALFDRAGIEHQTWNTGGYVMCHAIPVTKDVEGLYDAYILFSEVAELDEKIGFCYYPSETEEAPSVCWFNDQIKDGDAPDTAQRIFDWFVPMYEQLKAGTIPEDGSEV